MDEVCIWLKLKQRAFGVVKGATFLDVCFYFTDNKKEVLTFTFEDKSTEIYTIVKESKDPNMENLPFKYKEKRFMRVHIGHQDIDFFVRMMDAFA